MPAHDAGGTRIRRARPDEAPVLTALALRSKAHWGYTARQIEAWRDELTITPSTLQAFRVCVAESGERIAGFFALSTGAQDASLEHLWVDPAFIGRGIGRSLVAFACELARRHHVVRIRIDADPNAQAFYQTIGARAAGEIAAPIDGDPNRVRPQLVIDLDG